MSAEAVGDIAGKGLRFAAPLRAIERLSACNSENGLAIRATKTVDASDPYLVGHFPDYAIFPGAFIIESLRQAVASALGESDGLLPEIITLRSVRFFVPLIPGDCMTLDATVRPILGGMTFDADAHCRRTDGMLVARLKVEFCYRGMAGA